MLDGRAKILITGATGYTGRHACDYFSKAGCQVVGVSRSIISEDMNTVIMKQANLCTQEGIEAIVQNVKPDYILHLAGQNEVSTSWEEPVATFEANVLSTLYLLNAVWLHSPKSKVVVVGSALQTSRSDVKKIQHPYSLSKMFQENMAEAWSTMYGLHVLVAKPSNLIGPGRSKGVCSLFAQKIVDMEKGNERILEVNHLQTARDFVDVRDAIRAYETLFLKGESGETYPISTGVMRTLQQVIDVFQKQSRVPFTVHEVTKYSPTAALTDPTKLNGLGWKPMISFEQSLHETLDYYRHDF